MPPRATGRFHLYRYQLLPVDRHFQGDLYGAATVEELIAKKNQIFAEALSSPKAFSGGKTQIATQIVARDNDLVVYRIAANRSLQHETRDFKTEVIDNWPKIILAVWNAPDKQLIAVQQRANAFQNSEAVLKLLFDSIEPILSKHQLTALYDPLFEKKIFWDLVERYKGKIQEVDFELITPNMANISGTLPEDLKLFAKRTNAVKTRVAIASDVGSSLKLDKSDSIVNALVDYSSQGGGDIAIRITGVKKLLHTSRSVQEVSIDEATLQGKPEDVVSVLKEILK